MTIEVVKVYRIKGDHKKFRTYKAVVNRLAWRIVFAKYGDDVVYDSYGGGVDVRPIREPVFCDPCDCGGRDRYNQYHLIEPDYSEPPLHWDCPVHDRRHGYLRRLHDRLVRFLMVRYPMPEYAE